MRKHVLVRKQGGVEGVAAGPCRVPGGVRSGLIGAYAPGGVEAPPVEGVSMLRTSRGLSKVLAVLVHAAAVSVYLRGLSKV